MKRKILSCLVVILLVITLLMPFTLGVNAAEEPTESPLIGSWLFNFIVPLTIDFEYSLDFYCVNDGVTQYFDRVKVYSSSSTNTAARRIAYRSVDSGQYVDAYAWDGEYSFGSYFWYDTDYRCITITGGADVQSQYLLAIVNNIGVRVPTDDVYCITFISHFDDYTDYQIELGDKDGSTTYDALDGFTASNHAVAELVYPVDEPVPFNTHNAYGLGYHVTYGTTINIIEYNTMASITPLYSGNIHELHEIVLPSTDILVQIIPHGNTDVSGQIKMIVNYDGLSTDYQDGYADGYDIGYNTGYDLGYAAGLDDGASSNVNFGEQILGSTFDVPLKALNNWVLFETDSGIAVTMGGVFTALIGLSLFIIFLKMFAGG